MTDARPATKEDIAYVAQWMRESDWREIRETGWHGSEKIALVESCRWSIPNAFAFDWEGDPAAVVGAYARWPGVWSVWAFGTDNFPRVGLSVTRFVRRCMIPALLDAGAHRADCLTSADHTAAHRWLEALGARREATLREYGRDRRDFHLYSWRREDGAVRRRQGGEGGQEGPEAG